jgi:tight adherence protein B
MGATVTSARAAHKATAGRGAAEGHSLEHYDLVGENRRGPVRLQLGGVFPDRLLRLTISGQVGLAAGRVHVVEDGQTVPGVKVTYAGRSSATSTYLARYVSDAPTGDREVELGVAIDGVGAADVDYSSPPSRAIAVPATGRSFWGSGLSLVVTSFLGAALLALALLALLAPRQRRTGLQRRVAQFTAPVVGEAPELLDAPVVPRLRSLQGLLERLSWWPRFQERVEIARFERSAVELVAITAAVTLLVAVIAGAAAGFLGIGLIVLPIGPLVLQSLVQAKLRKQRQLFADQLAPHLEETASALRAGHGLASALAVMARSATEPSRAEWSRVVADEQLGRPLDVAMHSMATRTDCSEIEQVALVAALHGRTGGNMAEVLERVAEGVRERADLRRELQALTAQARLSRWVLTALPPCLIGLFELLDPAYMRPLFTTRGGLIVLGIAAVLLTTGSLAMRKLTNIKV